MLDAMAIRAVRDNDRRSIGADEGSSSDAAAGGGEPRPCEAGSGVGVVLRQALKRSAPKEVCEQLRLLHKRSATVASGSCADQAEDDESRSLNRDIAEKVATRRQFRELLELGSAASATEVLELLRRFPGLAGETANTAAAAGYFDFWMAHRPGAQEVATTVLAIALLRNAVDEVVEAILELHPQAAKRPIPWALVPQPPRCPRLHYPTREWPRVGGIRVSFGPAAMKADEDTEHRTLAARIAVGRNSGNELTAPLRWHKGLRRFESGGLHPLHFAVLAGRSGRLLAKLLQADPAGAALPVPVTERADQEQESLGFLHLLLWNRHLYPETELLRQVLQHSEVDTDDDAEGSALSLQALALATCSPDDASFVEDVARVGLAAMWRCFVTLGFLDESSVGHRMFHPHLIATALRTVTNARKAVADLKAGAWDRRALLAMLDETPAVGRILLDGRPLLWWLLMFKADSDVVMGLLQTRSAGLDIPPLLRTDVVLLALFRGCSSAVFQALAAQMPEAWSEKANIVRLMTSFESIFMGASIKPSDARWHSALQRCRDLGPTLWHIALALGCCEKALIAVLDVYPDLARQNHCSGAVPLLHALQHPSRDGRLWRRICEVHLEGVPVVFDLVSTLLEGLSADSRLGDGGERSRQKTLQQLCGMYGVTLDPARGEDGNSVRTLLSRIPAATLQSFLKYVQRHSAAAAPGSRQLALELNNRGTCSAAAVAELLRRYGAGLARTTLTYKNSTDDGRNESVRSVTGIPTGFRRDPREGQVERICSLLPLHYALVKQVPLEVVTLLYSAFPKAAGDEIAALDGPRLFSWRSSSDSCYAFDFVVKKILELGKTNAAYYPRSGIDDKHERELRQWAALAEEVLQGSPEVLAKGRPLGDQPAMPTLFRLPSSGVVPEGRSWDVVHEDYGGAVVEITAGRSGSVVEELMKLSGNALQACVPLILAVLSRVPKVLWHGRLAGKLELELAISSCIPEVINAVVVACPAAVRAVELRLENARGGTLENARGSNVGEAPAILRLLNRLRPPNSNNKFGLLYPIRDWARERLLWIGHLKDPSGLLGSSPPQAVRLICGYLGDPSSLRLMLDAYPDRLTAPRSRGSQPGAQLECLARRCIQDLLQDADQPFDAACVQRILRLVPDAARTPLRLRGVEAVPVPGGEVSIDDPYVSPLQAIIMNRKTHAPKLTGWVFALFPQALHAVDSKGMSPLTVLLSKLQQGCGRECAPQAMLCDWIDMLSSRHGADDADASASSSAVLGRGSLVAIDEREDGHIILSHGTFRWKDPSATQAFESKPSYLVGLHCGGQHARSRRVEGAEREDGEMAVVAADRIKAIVRRPPLAYWPTTLGTLLQESPPRMDLVNRVLDRSPAEALVAERLGAPRPLELALRQTAQVAAKVVPRLLELCPAAAAAPLSVRSAVELGLGADALAVPVLLALELDSPKEVTMALLQANPDCTLRDLGSEEAGLHPLGGEGSDPRDAMARFLDGELRGNARSHELHMVGDSGEDDDGDDDDGYGDDDYGRRYDDFHSHYGSEPYDTD